MNTDANTLKYTKIHQNTNNATQKTNEHGRKDTTIQTTPHTKQNHRRTNKQKTEGRRTRLGQSAVVGVARSEVKLLTVPSGTWHSAPNRASSQTTT